METAEFLPLTACWLTIALKFSFPGWRFIPKPRPRRTSASFGLSVNLSWAPLEAAGCWDASCIVVGCACFLCCWGCDCVVSFCHLLCKKSLFACVKKRKRL